MAIPEWLSDLASPINGFIAALAGGVGYFLRYRADSARLLLDRRVAHDKHQIDVAEIVAKLLAQQQVESKAEIMSLRSDNVSLRKDLQELWDRFEQHRRDCDRQISLLRAGVDPKRIPVNPNEKGAYP